LSKEERWKVRREEMNKGRRRRERGWMGTGPCGHLTRGKVIVESNSNMEGGEEEEVGREGRRTGSVYADLYK
jgi:hypothetical protein